VRADRVIDVCPSLVHLAAAIIDFTILPLNVASIAVCLARNCPTNGEHVWIDGGGCCAIS
jgi:hypothetical protein